MKAEQNVNLLTVSKIRFGDPITALGIGPNSILHGSVMGRIVHYSLESSAEKEIVNMTNEMVRDITVSADGGKYFIANGDSGWHIYPENASGPLKTYNIVHKGTHADICERSFTFHAKGYNVVLILASEEDGPQSSL